MKEDVQKMNFADNSFDVVLSNMCLHNIYNKPGREKACSEIIRVLKSEGVAIISDYKLVDEYAQIFCSLGAKVDKTDNTWVSAVIKINKL